MISRKIRSKYRYAILFWIIFGSALIICSLYISQWFLALLFLLFIVIGLYVVNIKCPSCNKSVLYNPINVFGIEINIWTSWIPKNCSKCGRQL
jgi:hypothetical protein